METLIFLPAHCLICLSVCWILSYSWSLIIEDLGKMKWKLTDMSTNAHLDKGELLYPEHLHLEGKLVTLGCAQTQRGLNICYLCERTGTFKGNRNQCLAAGSAHTPGSQNVTLTAKSATDSCVWCTVLLDSADCMDWALLVCSCCILRCRCFSLPACLNQLNVEVSEL